MQTLFHLLFRFIPMPVGPLLFFFFSSPSTYALSLKFMASLLSQLPFSHLFSSSSDWMALQITCVHFMKFQASRSSHVPLTLTFSYCFVPLIHDICPPVAKMYYHFVQQLSLPTCFASRWTSLCWLFMFYIFRRACIHLQNYGIYKK